MYRRQANYIKMYISKIHLFTNFCSITALPYYSSCSGIHNSYSLEYAAVSGPMLYTHLSVCAQLSPRLDQTLNDHHQTNRCAISYLMSFVAHSLLDWSLFWSRLQPVRCPLCCFWPPFVTLFTPRFVILQTLMDWVIFGSLSKYLGSGSFSLSPWVKRFITKEESVAVDFTVSLNVFNVGRDLVAFME